MDNLGSSIKRIIEIDYEQAFSNAKRFLSLLDDLAPSQIEGRKVLRRVITNELLLKFRVLHDDTNCDSDIEFLKIKKYLSDNMGLSEYWIETIIVSFADAFDIIYLPSISLEEDSPSLSQYYSNAQHINKNSDSNKIRDIDPLFSKCLSIILGKHYGDANEVIISQVVELCENDDYQTAFRILHSEAKKDNSFAMVVIALFYEFGYGVDVNVEKSMFWLQKAVNKGNPDAMEQLGEIYRFGRNNVTENYEEAFKWFSKAADLGQSEAMYFLGVMYNSGEFVEDDRKIAFQWFKKAAESDNVDALECLGDFYLNGNIIQQDYAEAFNCFMLAADSKSSYASFKIAEMFENGIGMPKSHEDAIKWFLKAADLGNPEAQLKIGYAYLKGDYVQQSYSKSADYFKKSAFNGLSSAQLALGYMYEGGYGTPKNPFKAFECYKKAAEQGESNAFYSLGLCYVNGIGVKKDFIEAVKHMKQAASQDIVDAVQWLKKENIDYSCPPSSYIYGSDLRGIYQMSGANIDGVLNGAGILQYIYGNSNGQWYEGEFKDGCFDGEGMYHFSKEDFVFGIFEKGFNGILTHQIKDKVVYKGEYSDGRPHGNGISYNDDGTGFQGVFHEGKAWKGQGTIVFTSKKGHQMRAVGKFVNGGLDGLGQMINTTRGEWYEGYFIDGEFNGKGTIHLQDGKQIFGVFQKDLHGNVKIIDNKNILTYEGGYNGVAYHGQGILYNSDGSTLQGEWNNGIIIRGQGTLIHKLKTGITVKDVGYFENDNLQGQGKRFIISGQEAGGHWEGNFKNGCLHGLCIFYNKEGGRQETQCVNGVFHGTSRGYSMFGVLCWETIFKNGKEIGPRKETYLYKKSQGKV